jgi:hypothetical protein
MLNQDGIDPGLTFFDNVRMLPAFKVWYWMKRAITNRTGF